MTVGMTIHACNLNVCPDQLIPNYGMIESGRIPCIAGMTDRAVVVEVTLLVVRVLGVVVVLLMADIAIRRSACIMIIRVALCAVKLTMCPH